MKIISKFLLGILALVSFIQPLVVYASVSPISLDVNSGPVSTVVKISVDNYEHGDTSIIMFENDEYSMFLSVFDITSDSIKIKIPSTVCHEQEFSPDYPCLDTPTPTPLGTYSIYYSHATNFSSNQSNKVAFQVTDSSSGVAHVGGTNVNIDNTIWYITGYNCKSAYTSAAAFLSYGFKFSDVINASESDRNLPTCRVSVESQSVFDKFVAPQAGKVICSDRGSDKGTCYLILFTDKKGFTSASVFTGQGYSFSNVLYGDVSWLNTSIPISSTEQQHDIGIPINDNGTIKMLGNERVIAFPDLASFYSYGYGLADIVPANAADRSYMSNFVTSIQGHKTATQLHPLR